MNDVMTQVQEILDQLATLSSSADNLNTTAEFCKQDEAKADLGEEALNVLPQRLSLARLTTRFADLMSLVSDDACDEDRHCAMADLLADLRHDAVRNGIDFNRASLMSETHFESCCEWAIRPELTGERSGWSQRRPPDQQPANSGRVSHEPRPSGREGANPCVHL